MLIGALSLPAAAPVPKEFVAPLDKHAPTTYGTQYLVATGPYMVEANPKTGQFAGIGYQAGKSLTLVRNPNWDPSTYTSAFKPPAYLDRINVEVGGAEGLVELRRVRCADDHRRGAQGRSRICRRGGDPVRAAVGGLPQGAC